MLGVLFEKNPAISLIKTREYPEIWGSSFFSGLSADAKSLTRGLNKTPRSSSREVRIRVPFLFSVVYFSRGTLPPKRNGFKRALLGDLDPQTN